MTGNLFLSFFRFDSEGWEEMPAMVKKEEEK